MKKAKIMVTIIAVVGVVAGVLAFNAHHYGATIYTGPDAAHCTFTLVESTITPNQPCVQTFATAIFGDPNCSLTCITVQE